MGETFDPKDIKVLSDILALVLEESSGSAQNALDALRTRAQRNTLTGGALKNLFISLATDPMRTGATAREAQLRQTIARLEGELRTQQIKVRTVQADLSRTQRDAYSLQAEVVTNKAQQPWRYIAIAFGVSAGLLLGVAASQLYHSLTDPPPIDRSLSLR